MTQKLSFFSSPVEVIKQYHQNGFHIEYDVFSAEQCEEVKKCAHALSHAQQQNYSPVMMPHREDPHFLTYMKNEKITTIMAAFLSGKISGLQSQFFYMKPGTRGFTSHQDNYFVQAKNDAFASAWLALDDTSKSNGGLIVYPGTHQLGLLPVRETDIHSNTAQDPNAYRTEIEIPDGYDPVHVEVPAGAALFIHSCIVHGSNENTSSEHWRHVLLNTYILQNESFRPGRDAKRAEIALS